MIEWSKMTKNGRVDKNDQKSSRGQKLPKMVEWPKMTKYNRVVKNDRKWSNMDIYLYMFINTVHSQFMESIENSQFGYNFADCPQAAAKVI